MTSQIYKAVQDEVISIIFIGGEMILAKKSVQYLKPGDFVLKDNHWYVFEGEDVHGAYVFGLWEMK